MATFEAIVCRKGKNGLKPFRIKKAGTEPQWGKERRDYYYVDPGLELVLKVAKEEGRRY